GTQIVKGQFNLSMSLFGIPFVLGTLLFGSLAVMMVCGKTVIWTDRDDGYVFAGVGPFGWTRHFQWSTITGIEEELVPIRQMGSSGRMISLVGDTKLTFGSLVNDPRRYFLLRGLRYELARRI